MSAVSVALQWGGVVTAGMQVLGFVHGYTFQTEKLYDVIGALNSVVLLFLAFYLPTTITKTTDRDEKLIKHHG